MKDWKAGIVCAAVVIVNVLCQCMPLRWDMTNDHRYSLCAPTQNLLHHLQGDVTIEILLRGPLNSGFTRLKNATQDMAEEMDRASNQSVHLLFPDSATYGLPPIIIHERSTKGQTAQTQVYPYAIVRYNNRHTVVNLLQNQLGKSGEENLNRSIENLEYALTEALRTLHSTEVEKVAFLEGHQELPEEEVMDFATSLARFYQVDRGALQGLVGELNDYKAVVIADPQTSFSAEDKYILDQYLMQGGRILWLVNGVRFQQDQMQQSGMTPVIPLDLQIQDMLFRYGVRIAPVLVQDWQCLSVPVNVAQHGAQPNWQPMPWTYAPLLLTAQTSPITCHLMQVSATFVSAVETVGEADGLNKQILLASSTRSRVTGCPGKVDLSWASDDPNDFPEAFVPVAMSVEGNFTSLFAHQLPPEGIHTTEPPLRSGNSKQVVVAAGSIARNDWLHGQPLPAGYDRYSGVQYGNRDFLTNAVLWLTDENGWMQLRQKEVTLRLINNRRAQDTRIQAQIGGIGLPLALLLMVAASVWEIRKKVYER